jgi:hypothetical protein
LPHTQSAAQRQRAALVAFDHLDTYRHFIGEIVGRKLPSLPL